MRKNYIVARKLGAVSILPNSPFNAHLLRLFPESDIY
jgi:hypothetical protein